VKYSDSIAGNKQTYVRVMSSAGCCDNQVCSAFTVVFGVQSMDVSRNPTESARLKSKKK